MTRYSPVRARCCVLLLLTLLTPAMADRHQVDPFNYVIGTQTFGSKYQFTDEPRLVETARETLKLGSNILKFRLGPRFAEDNYSGPNPGDFSSLTALAAGDPAIRTVLEMPFAYYFLWVNPMQEAGWRDDDGYTARDQAIEYREIYDLAVYLLETYDGTGKQFYFGNWEGDWLLLGHYERTKYPEERHIASMIDWFNNRQRAVDDAKRDHPDSDVGLYHYAELNLVEKAILGNPAIVNKVLPHTNVDFVSYSAYEIDSDHDLTKAMARTMDFIVGHLPEKAGLPERRVFIGEFGYKSNVLGPEVQRGRTVEFIEAALDWGSPFILYWQMYDNEVVNGRYNGFWLIDNEGKKWPLYHILSDYLQRSKAYVEAYRGEHGRPPAPDVFNRHARTIIGQSIGEDSACDSTAARKEDAPPLETLGFESGTLEGWIVSGGSASVISDQPHSGRYHLKLEAGKTSTWAVAAHSLPAAAGEWWEASIHALRKEGAAVKLKLEFYAADGSRLKDYLRTGVESEYMRMTLRAPAPEGTAEVRLVAAVDEATRAEPAVGYFDDALLLRIEASKNLFSQKE